jgi:thiol:disulfide interchange protein
MKLYYKLLVILILTLLHLDGLAQEKKIYNPFADAAKNIADSVKKAKAMNKHVLIQAGGNWCVWCIEFNRFTSADRQIDSMIKKDYIVYHLNYSPENRNSVLFARLGYPQRFGFPVFLVLDGSGNRLHTQNSAYLEQGRSYNKTKVIEFLSQWNKLSLDPRMYKNF